MERPTSAPVEGSTPASPRFPVCASLLVLLFGWHAWMTLSLFGPELPFDALTDDRPILSGRHAQNLYLGVPGAQALQTTGTGSCYDTDFYAGFPKTPIFNGARFAEIFLLLGGGGYQPAAYKIGIAVLCLLVPVLLALTARGIGLGGPATLATTAAGLLVWWGGPAHEELRAGEFPLLIAGLATLAHVAMLVRFDRAPGPLTWLGLLVTGTLGWFAQPVLFPLLLPLFLIYYFTTGPRHQMVLWHLALWGSEVGSLALNLWWLPDWITFWWVRAALAPADALLVHRTFQTFWEAPVWGDAADRLLGVVLLVSALPGVCILHVNRERPAARLLGLGMTGLLVLTVLGMSWEPLGQVGTAALLTPALWFACPLAAHAWTQTALWLQGLLGGPRAALVLSGLGGLLLVVLPGAVWGLAERCLGATPLSLGLHPEHDDIVDKLIAHTGPEARILWEERPTTRTAPQWAPLLPLLTGRSFIGGLDPERVMEHSSIGLHGQRLLDRPVSTWSDTFLEDYCRRYNVGWIVCWSPNVVDRLRKWTKAVLVTDLTDGGRLFAVRPQRPSFVLKGRAELVYADSHHITLADVVPDNGVVVLSLHYQRGLRASPSRVQVERESDATDPIGFIRLRVAAPVARVTITWDNH